LNLDLCTPLKVDVFACQLFAYRGNVVALDIVGAGLPIIVSIILLLRMGLQTGRSTSWRRVMGFILLTTILGLATAFEYATWDSIFGGIAINTRLLLYTVILPIGVIEFWTFNRFSLPRLSISRAYVIGTFGLAMSDLIRIFSGAANFSPQIIGGAGPLDVIFSGPLFVIVGYLSAAVLYSAVQERRSPLPSEDNQAIAFAKTQNQWTW
jgi:hypothetical protein